MRGKILIIGGAVVLLALAFVTFRPAPAAAPAAKRAAHPNSTTPKAVKPTPAADSFDANAYSQTDPASLWVVVDKQRPLTPATYVPANLVIPHIPLRSNITGDEKYVRSDTAAALEQLGAAAQKDGLTINLQSGYRSYNFQVALYNRYVSEQGQAVADTQSARPGYSEHQTGLAADVGGVTKPSCNVEQCFADTPEGQWIATHAYEYGFIIRYPQGEDNVTGYEYEPWHLRYVGTALANEMHNRHINTLEAFFGLPDAPAYR